MNRFTPIAETPAVALARFDHPTGTPHRDPGRETAPTYSVNFIEHGRFELQLGRESWQLSPRTIFLTRPGMVYRCRHFEAAPSDVCLSLSYSREFVTASEVLPEMQARPVVGLTNRLAYLRWQLARLTNQQRDPLATESLAAELLATACAPGAGSSRLFKQSQLAWYADRVEAVRATLQQRYAEPHSLSSLAGSVGMSPFHLARVFRELTGAPPHRYLLQVRLARAAERLRAGAGVTDTCFATGFGNLSHFIRLFRRTFGVSPSRYRRSPRPVLN